MASKAGFEIISEDPEVMALQAMVKGLRHITIKNLSPVHLQVLATTEIIIKVFKRNPNLQTLSGYIGCKDEDISVEVDQLVHSRYLHEIINPFGELNVTYKMGSMGGTALRHILDRKKGKAA